MAVGQNVYIHREYNNPFNPTAVAVCNLNGDQLGYVARELDRHFQAGVYLGRVEFAGRVPGEYLFSVRVEVLGGGRPLVTVPFGLVYRDEEVVEEEEDGG